MGCVSLGPKFVSLEKPKKGMSKLYMYRVSSYYGSAGSPYICINGKVSGESVDGGYYSVDLNPGNHTLEYKISGAFSGTVPLKAKAGNTYFLRHSMEIFNGAIQIKKVKGKRYQQPLRQSPLVELIRGDNSGQVKLVFDSLDQRVMKELRDPGNAFVKKSLALKELKSAKLFKVPNYRKNFCEQRKIKLNKQY